MEDSVSTDPGSPCITPTYQGSPSLLLSSARAGFSPPCSLRSQLPTGRPEPRSSSPKQIAIPGFSTLLESRRSTLLHLILGRRFLRGSVGLEDYKALSNCCRWLSIVQNRSYTDVYDDVSSLVQMGLVRLVVFTSRDYDGSSFCSRIDASFFRVFDKFVKKVIRNNPSYDTHRLFGLLDDTKFLSAGDMSAAGRIRVLKLDGCQGLEIVDFRGLGRLRSLFLRSCPMLKEVTGWSFLRKLGWLDIINCPSLHGYPDFRNLSCLKEYRVYRQVVSDCPPAFDLGISQCFRLRTLDIQGDKLLEASGDLSSLKCLQVLNFAGCFALSTITGLSELHSLTSLILLECYALSRLSDLSHMKELVRLDVGGTALEEIPGVEKLVSLKILDCADSKLKHLPDLRHLSELREVWLDGTALVEKDPSFYFDEVEVSEETRPVDVSDISDTEHNVSDYSSDEEYEKI